MDEKYEKLDRTEFMQKTGIFISCQYFEIIKLEYQDFLNNVDYPTFLKEMNLADTKLPKSKMFPLYWLALNIIRGSIYETRDKILKYCLFDFIIVGADDNEQEIDTKELFERCSQCAFYLKDKCYEQCDLVHKLLNSRKINKEIADKLLKNEPALYEEIYEIQKKAIAAKS